MNLNNKVIVITGGARGIGYAMALDLGQHGAKLALVDVSQELLDDAIAQLNKQGIEAKPYVCNVTNEAQVTHTFEQIRKDFTTFHGLINNAGILRDALLIKTKEGAITKRLSLDEWQSVIDVNLTGVFLCGREAATHFVNDALTDEDFKQNGGAVIVNISSVSKEGNFGQSNYSAAKAGVAAMTVTWSKELAQYGIRCAGIAPGFVETEMTASMNPKAFEAAISKSALGRAGQPQEIAHTARFIFENDFICGRVFNVDGGTRV